MIVMLGVPNCCGCLLHLNKSDKAVSESKLALVERHTYNPAHRK
jgi:hypothetical protein